MGWLVLVFEFEDGGEWPPVLAIEIFAVGKGVWEKLPLEAVPRSESELLLVEDAASWVPSMDLHAEGLVGDGGIPIAAVEGLMDLTDSNHDSSQPILPINR